MGVFLDDLRAGVPFGTVLEALTAASPFAGQGWEKQPDPAGAYDQADDWEAPVGTYESASEDLAVAFEEGLIVLDQYAEAVDVVNR